MTSAVDQQVLLRAEIESFLFDEAEILDDGRYHEWLALCDAGVRYVIPVRLTREHGSSESNSTEMAHWDDDYNGLEMRVLRLDTEYAWAEDPPSRVRRFVSNVRVRPVADNSNEFDARSNLLVFRNRGDSPKYDLLSAERHDRIRRTKDGLRLARRRVVLDHAVLNTHNLAFFL